MSRTKLIGLLTLSLCFILSGCIVRTYQTTRDRVDQDLTGNRGYLLGSIPADQSMAERKTTRTTQIVEIELHSPIKFERKTSNKSTMPVKIEEPATEESIIGNRGYITKSAPFEKAAITPTFKKYTVQKGDTLQKISKKFYGTTKKWVKIYNANKSIMKGPNKIYPGQTISIPETIEAVEEYKGNLK
ncbi:MAG: LysM peptidoglycan-binding domain-containing protein [Candidatus Omnitrophota bacterium]